MTVFKTFWKVVNKYKGTIIGYTVLLLIFGTLSMSSSASAVFFTVIGLSGSRLAKSKKEKEIIIWLLEKDQKYV